jgi:hypothetical protein
MASLSSPIRPTIDVVARTVSSSAISGGAGGAGGGGALAIQPQASLVNVERNLEIQTTQNVQQTQEISALKSAVDALRTETTTLNKGLVSISNLIQQDSAVEKQQEAEKAESERKLAETNVRLGKESQLEQRITNSLVTPVQALQQKVGNIFARIGEALTTLFAGWLTNQGIEALKAASEGNKEKLEEIKNNVLKTIGFGVAAIGAIKIGFDLVIKTITGITGKIGSILLKLATAPLKVLRSSLQAAPLVGGLFGGGKKPSSGGGGKPKGGGGVLGAAGKFVTLLSGWMNFQNQEYVDTTLAAMSLASRAPGAIGAIGKIAGIAFTSDEIAEAFGKNIFGDPKKDKIVDEIAKPFKEEKQKETEKPASAAKVAPAATPKTPVMGDKKDDKSETDPKNMTPGPVSGSANIQPTSDSDISDSGASAAGTSSPSTTSTTSGSSSASMAQTPMISPSSAATTAPPAAEAQTPMISPSSAATTAPPAAEAQTPMMSPSPNSPPGALVPGQRPDKSLNSEQFKAATQAREEAKVKGLTGKEYDVYVANAAMNAKPSDANISSPAQVQPLPKPTQNVGELTEPAPNVVMMPSGQSNNQQSSISQAPTNGTDTPLISSSNPDNFYVLYSQLNYNVVI